MSNPDSASWFDEIYKATSKPVLTFIKAKCGHSTDIEDIFQETYMELYRVLERHGAGYIENDKAFILRIAKRKIAKHYALMEQLRIFVPMASVDDSGSELVATDFHAGTYMTEDFTENKNQMIDIMQVIRKKPEDIQKVFYLTYAAGFSITEVSRALKISESSVKNKLYRTLKELRVLFQQDDAAM